MTSITEEGLKKFPWWKDWRGETCVIVCSGPSLKKEDVEAFRGKAKFIAVKENYNVCPWADVVYGCDAHWWVYRRGLKEFSGLKLSYDQVHDFPGPIQIQMDRTQDRILLETPGLIGNGGNSGFQSMNIAAQFGAKQLVMLGLDCHARSGAPHWYGRSAWPGAWNPGEQNFFRWLKAFDNAAKDLAAAGISVLNCSPFTSIKSFPVRSAAEIISLWRLHEPAAPVSS